MTSNPNKAKILKKSDEIDKAWIKAMGQQHDVESRSLASIYVADNLKADGHKVPAPEDVYNIDSNGKQKFSVELFDAWARYSSGERFVSLNQGGDLYIYKDGIYAPYAEGWLNAVMKACSQNEGVTEHYTKETVARIGKNSEMDPALLESQDPNITIIGNGALNTLTGEVQDYDPTHVAFSKLDVKHVPDAICPIWEEFLEYTLQESERESLRELFGYCLVSGYPYHAAWFLLGSGQNGKGVAMEILRAMLGKRNCSAVPLQEVNERFYSHDLYNKYANISGDTSPRALCDASMYKMLTGGDDIRVEQKGKDAFDFVNHAKIISSMNELMKSGDQSDGFFRRFVLIRFAKNITAERIHEKDGFEKDIISNELPGVLNWAIEGLIRVRTQGGFSWQLGKSKDDLRKIWNTEADHIKAFIDVCADVGPGRIIAKNVMYRAYVAWHVEQYNVLPKEGQDVFTKSRDTHGFSMDSRKATGDAADIWGISDNGNYRSIGVYTGICLRNTPGDLRVDSIYVSEHWNDITGGMAAPKGLNSSSVKESDDSMTPYIDSQLSHVERMDDKTGSEIMAIIQERVKAYGGNDTDHVFNVIESLIEDRGYDVAAIKPCIARYREGHRMYVPPIKEA